MNLRCFIAIGIPDPIKQEIGNLLDILRKYDVDIKWVALENVHLTLKFLGDTPEALLPGIRESILTIVSSYEPFYIKIYGTGVFPNKKYPKVIWVGIVNSEALVNLQGDIENSMSLLGYKKEDKAFNPHLTMGRVRNQRGIFSIVNEIDIFQDKDFGTFRSDRLKFMKSELKPKGPDYTCLFDMPFGKREVPGRSLSG